MFLNVQKLNSKKYTYVCNVNENVDVTPSIYGESILEICNVNGFRRLVACKTNIEDVKPGKDCSCIISSSSKIASIKDYTMNYPDCMFNSSLLDLTIPSHHEDVYIDDSRVLKWKSIVFKERNTSVVMTSIGQLEASETMTMPSASVQFNCIVCWLFWFFFLDSTTC